MRAPARALAGDAPRRKVARGRGPGWAPELAAAADASGVAPSGMVLPGLE